MPRRAKPAGSGGRTDLLTPPGQAVKTPTGLPYGQNSSLADAQRQMPLASSSAPTPGPPTGGPQGPPGGGVPPMGVPESGMPSPDPIADATAMPYNPVGLHEPSIRPNEPVTSGIDSGAGPGSNALNPAPPSVASLLGSMAGTDPALSGLANFAASQHV